MDMIYVPCLKTKQEELRVIHSMNDYLSDSLIPLIEIVDDIYEEVYETDSTTGDIRYEKKPGNKRFTKVKATPTDDDIITLDRLEAQLEGKKAFIDYLRFVDGEYANYDITKVELSRSLSNNFSEYKTRLLSICSHINLIPVFSLKPGLEPNLSGNSILPFLTQLRRKCSSMAIRVHYTLYDEYKEVLKQNLRDTDYLLFDIREESIDSQYITCEEIKTYGFKAKKILLNSPRSNRSNTEYETHGYTELIDNSVRRQYKDYKFDGFGDFGGLKDSLPNSARGGSGSAIALIFMDRANKFLVFRNPNSSLGNRGYALVKRMVLRAIDTIDPHHSCPAMNKIRSYSKTGSFSWWINITFTRYIHQIYTSASV